MSKISTSAPGKAILFGEHAVVYGYPAISVPVLQVSATVQISSVDNKPEGWVWLSALDIGLNCPSTELPLDHPLILPIKLVADELGIKNLPAMRIDIHSTIPVAAGLGSGAAVSVALIRAIAEFLGQPLSDDHVSTLAFNVEKIYHGTPSGIDNSVITYSEPIYFVRGEQPSENCIKRIAVGKTLNLVISDTGIPSPTATTVRDVRQAWLNHPEIFNRLFTQIGELVNQARVAIERGETELLGVLANENHALLTQIGVSCAELDRLVDVARASGALGAKLSGGGRGGNMIALVSKEKVGEVVQALASAGAVHTIACQVDGGNPEQRIK
jgi:mevalonate kinase